MPPTALESPKMAARRKTARKPTTRRTTKSTARRRSPANPAVRRSRTKTVRRRVTTRARKTTRRATTRQTIALPGGINLNIGKTGISVSARGGPKAGTWSLPGGYTIGR